MESSKNILSLFGRGPDSYSALAILRYVYSMHSRLHSFFRFDDGAKLKKRNSRNVSYLKKKCLISVSYLQDTLNQINMNEEKVVTSALFPLESYFPIFFSLEMTLYSEGDMP